MVMFIQTIGPTQVRRQQAPSIMEVVIMVDTAMVAAQWSAYATPPNSIVNLSRVAHRFIRSASDVLHIYCVNNRISYCKWRS